jgi:hypothetical protein
MSRKLISGQKPFKILVANLRGGSDPSKGPSGNPVKVRSEFTLQHFPEIAGNEQGTENQQGMSPGTQTRVGHVDYNTSPIPVRATGTITVAANTFAGPTTIRLGEYVLTTDVDFAVGGSVGATAANLEAAIDALPGYSASVAADVVTVIGPAGPVGNRTSFFAGGASPQNFTFAPDRRTLGAAEPAIGPVLIS